MILVLMRIISFVLIFEDLRNVHLLNAIALHEEILKRAEQTTGKVYFSLMRFKRLRIGKSA